MKHSEFKIGESFRTGAGLWRVTDIGTRVVVAIRIDRTGVVSIPRRGAPIAAKVVAVKGDQVEVELMPREPDRILNEAEAEAEGWFKGPPYAVAECVFDEYDQRGCSIPGDEQQ
jgi:hypothetical protein